MADMIQNPLVENGSYAGAISRSKMAALVQAVNVNAGALSGIVDGASFNSSTNKISFKHGSDVLFELDAAAFVKDGMVEDVSVVNGNLVITFNTAAGKQPISIALTDIFDPNNYYNKTAVNEKLSERLKVTELHPDEQGRTTFLTEAEADAVAAAVGQQTTSAESLLYHARIYPRISVNDNPDNEADVVYLRVHTQESGDVEVTYQYKFFEGALSVRAIRGSGSSAVIGSWARIDANPDDYVPKTVGLIVVD